MWNILNIYIFLLLDPGFNFVAIGKYCVPCCKEAYTTYTFSLQGNLVFYFLKFISNTFKLTMLRTLKLDMISLLFLDSEMLAQALSWAFGWPFFVQLVFFNEMAYFFFWRNEMAY
jgi:hypothetical protein